MGRSAIFQSARDFSVGWPSRYSLLSVDRLLNQGLNRCWKVEGLQLQIQSWRGFKARVGLKGKVGGGLVASRKIVAEGGGGAAWDR
jgi:hypothetical protein